jgi:hypothetical protein
MGILIRVRKIGSFIFWRVQRWHGVEPGVGLPESVRFELMLMLAGTEAEAVADAGSSRRRSGVMATGSNDMANVIESRLPLSHATNDAAILFSYSPKFQMPRAHWARQPRLHPGAVP